jgi:Family of unknown function (DUF6152)
MEMNMQRRLLLAGTTLLALRPAWAHHGWSSFDQTRPIYLEGRVARVSWRNPHAELDLEVSPSMALPADLFGRPVPAQSAPVDGPAILKAATLPTRKDKLWHIELAPLTRMDAWKVAPLTVGQTVAVVGFTFAEQKGDPILRVEYLLVGGQAYGLRSSPA